MAKPPSEGSSCKLQGVPKPKPRGERGYELKVLPQLDDRAAPDAWTHTIRTISASDSTLSLTSGGGCDSNPVPDRQSVTTKMTGC